MYELHKIISGGQTGADQGALAGARSADFETGGFATRGWRTENGCASTLLQAHGLVEHHNSAYPGRTLANVKAADGTLIIGRLASRGSALTLRYCEEHRKPSFAIPWRPRNGAGASLADLDNLIEWINHPARPIKILNVAGNRESKNIGIFAETMLLIDTLCRRVSSYQHGTS